MTEFSGQAIILQRKELRERDSEIIVFTLEHGKLSTKAISARAITSKLSAHLQPGLFSFIRLVAKNSFLIVDALKIRKLKISLSDLAALADLLPEMVPDEPLWHLLTKEKFSWKVALALLGWDPQEAQCFKCAKTNPTYFYTRTQDFACESCARTSRLPISDLILVH